MRDERRPRRGRSPRTSRQGAVRRSGAASSRTRATSASSSTRSVSSSGGRPADSPSTGRRRATAARATPLTSPTPCSTRNDADVYQAFLRGLFEADGTVTSGYPSWTTAKAEFADEVQTLMLALGFVTTRSHQVSGRGSDLHVVRLLNRAAQRAVARRDRVHLRAQVRPRRRQRSGAGGPLRPHPGHSCDRRPSRSAERPRSQGRADGAVPVGFDHSPTRRRPVPAHGRRRTRSPARLLLRHDRHGRAR